jgi:GNAT superfamily N-acetyltransferase
MNEVTTYYLEMKSVSALKEKTDAKGLEIYECETNQFQFNKFLYQTVGEQWNWYERLVWSDQQWKSYVDDENLKTWVAYTGGTPAGFFELQRQEGSNVELAYFGLTPNFVGKGLGGYLLSQAISAAWAWEGTKRVWLHTCSLDHPGALHNYKARGMEVYKVEKSEQSHKSKLAGFIIDCKTDDLDSAARFWSKALGLEIKVFPGEEGEKYVGLVDPYGRLQIEVQSVEHESRVHLDIESDNIEAEVARLEKIGAKKISELKSWCVMESPTGQQFCVVPKASSLFEQEARQW